MKSKNKVKIPWSDRNYTDWTFGMYPRGWEKFKRRCILIQLVRFIVLSLKIKKVASIND